ncbi:hypothetical protein G3I18_28815 [Actinospica acidiphila]|uniref:Uncharacterized protein n=1 Tax=Actinospica acidiphila TaxID=304899 RepID=A0A9X5CQS0_9ACTN|nr:hypothetical protein [Actinospica acidiphila]NEC52528.1 hypothetical protein [Actinospica acidiphila]
MSAAVPLASWKTQMFESLLGFLPDWVQITVLALVVLALLTAWALKLKRRIAARRAVRTAASVPAQASGADFLGPYAPRNQDATAARSGTREPSGADFLGAYAPRREDGGQG